MQDLRTYDNGEARSFGFAYGLLVGTALGAAVALLFAPKPGSELRGQLADATTRIRERAGHVYNRASAAMDDMASRSRTAAP
jgi:gas vesicle protein